MSFLSLKNISKPFRQAKKNAMNKAVQGIKSAARNSVKKFTTGIKSPAGMIRSLGNRIKNTAFSLANLKPHLPTTSTFLSTAAAYLKTGIKAGVSKLISKFGDKLFDIGVDDLIKCDKSTGQKYVNTTMLLTRYMTLNLGIKTALMGIQGAQGAQGSDAVSGNEGRLNRFPRQFVAPYLKNSLDHYKTFVNYLDSIDNTSNNNRYGAVDTRGYTDYQDDDFHGINIYQTQYNTFPDELGKLIDAQSATTDRRPYGAGAHIWGTDHNRNSILTKTKKLFQRNKIDTLISRFCTTNADVKGSFSSWDVGTAEFGMSHGRNLLTKDAEEQGTAYAINGYINPYCRVWTHHYQMDTTSKLIRPFLDNEGNFVSSEALHSWSEFSSSISYNVTDKYMDPTDDKKQVLWGWKDSNSGAKGWKHSVLRNGFVQIAPYRDRYKDGVNNIHTKDCMFSIENLAWKGYDPYSFEKALSWEQRGPMGGRIMWFPPYGIQFNESTNVQWNATQFIGRGEPVYTYANTARTGNLTFQLLIDHPSVLDYATWYDNETGKINSTVNKVDNDYNVKNIDYNGEKISMADIDDKLGSSAADRQKHFEERQAYLNSIYGTKDGNDYDDKNDLKDTDILRFFAGCDYETLTKHAKPTPMTDEYVKTPPPEVTYQEPPKEIVPPDIPEKNIKLTFFIFYPNNYSGCYDLPTATTDHAPASVQKYYNHTSRVHSIAYLINGHTAQKKLEGGAAVDIPINIDDPYAGEVENMDPDPGHGYEMCKTPNRGITSRNADINNPTNDQAHWPIVGSSKPFFTFTPKGTGTSNYKPKESFKYVSPGNQIWFYRIDGNTHVPVDSNAERFANTYDQKLLIKANYLDNNSNGLNADAAVVKSMFPGGVPDTDENVLVSLLDMVYALTSNDEGLRAKLKPKYTHPDTSRQSFKSAQEVYDKRFNTNTHNYGINKTKVDKIIDLLTNYEITQVDGYGFSNSHGINKLSVVNNSRNYQLALQRINTGIDWLIEMGVPITREKTYTHPSEKVTGTDKTSVDNDSAKVYRSAKIVISFRKAAQKAHIDSDPNPGVSNRKFEGGWQLVKGDFNFGKKPYHFDEVYIRTVEDNPDYYLANDGSMAYDAEAYPNGMTPKPSTFVAKKSHQETWVIVPDGPHKGQMCLAEKIDDVYTGPTITERNGGKAGDLTERNALRYDQEYYFFRTLKERDPLTWASLKQKVRYFDPMYHSMTPEGFNARLTFLQQCTRQGSTIGTTDVQGKQADNLAFGRPPICVLRLGDFYKGYILIQNLNISYEAGNGMQWDLNQEGAGVQPMLANVNLSIVMIGGSSMAGPIQRLQNAMTFNFYANSEIYDNRADRISYATDDMNEQEGGVPQTNFGQVANYVAYNTAMTNEQAATNAANKPVTEKTIEETDKES